MMKTLYDAFEFMITWEQRMYDSEYQLKVLDVREVPYRRSLFACGQLAVLGMTPWMLSHHVSHICCPKPSILVASSFSLAVSGNSAEER
jgi:hypothetical protein